MASSDADVGVSELRRDIAQLNARAQKVRGESVAQVLQLGPADARAIQDPAPLDAPEHARVAVLKHTLLGLRPQPER